MMTHFTHKYLVPIALAASMLFGWVGVAAASDLSVSYQSDPLFYNSNLAPGESVSKTVTVTNTGTVNQSLYLDTKNSSSDGLADVMTLSIASSSITYFTDTFSNLFTTAQVFLGDVAPAATRTFVLTATMATSSDNMYQATTMGFDLCLGFSGGDIVCDGTSGSSTGGGGGGGVSAFSDSFRLYNEAVGGISTVNGQAIVTWNTNRPATSYVVCGNSAHGPFDLDPVAPYLGYEFAVGEITNLVDTHALVVTVPEAGTYECRPASREQTAGGFTVGNPVTFTIPAGVVLGATTVEAGLADASASASPAGEVLGVSTSTVEEEGPGGVVAGVAASLATALEQNDCVLLWLLLLVLISFLWSIIDDWIRHRELFRQLFVRQIVFSAVYTLFLLLLAWWHVLVHVWWVFASAWAVMTAVDYRAHIVTDDMYTPRQRQWFYGTAGLLFVVTSILFGLPCIWWPFAIIASVAATLLLLGWGD